MIDWLLGRGKVTVNTRTLNALMYVLVIQIRVRWLHWKVLAVDPITFLLLLEKLADHKDYSKDFVYKLHKAFVGTKTNDSFTIPSFAVKAAQKVLGAIGNEVYLSLKKIDALNATMADSMLSSNVLTEEAKNKIRQRDTMMQQYRRAHALENGYDLPAIIMEDNGSIH